MSERDFKVKKGLVVVEGVTAASLDISGDVDVDGTLEADAITLNGTSLATSATTDTTNASNIGSGTLATGRLAAALTAQTSILNTSLAVGRDAHNQIKFSTDDQIIFRVGNADGVVFKASGEIEAASLDISGDVDVDGTLEADAITVNGSALASSATTDTTNASNIGSGTLATGRLAAALTAQTSMLNTSLVVGRDADNQIKFSTDDQIVFRVGAGDGVTFKASGEIEAASLDISGDVDVDGTLETDNLTVGGQQGTDGQVLTSTGSGVAWEDAAGGASALNDLTDVISNITNFTDSILISPDGAAPPHGTLSSAEGNIGIGKDVLSALTSADKNIAIGYQAMQDATTGGNNIGIGVEALKELETTTGIVAIGYNAGKNATGTQNVFLGYSAGKRASAGTSQSNVGIGYNALQHNFGNQNVVIGNQAGIYLTSASNTIVGNNAGRNLTSSYNTSLGSDSLNAATSAEDNVAIGYAALDTLSTGDNNTALGYKAGDAVNTGSNNILLGHQAGDNITSGSNNLIIGSVDAGAVDADSQIRIASGDGNVLWISGDSNGIKAHKIKVVPITGTTQLTDAQSGSYVYVTGSGVPELPDTAELGQQYTIINNKGSQITVGLGSNGSGGNNTLIGTATVDDDKAKTFVAVATNTWFAIG